MAKLSGALKGKITKMFKKGLLLPAIRKAIEPEFPDINTQRIKTVLRAHFMELCDDLWAVAVKLKAGNRCIIDNSAKTLNAHHLIGRSNYKFRWDIDNGVCLGAYRHRLADDMAAHGSTAATARFMDWMQQNRLSQWMLMRANMLDPELIKCDVYFLLETAKRLEGEIWKMKNAPRPDILARKKNPTR